MTFLSLVASLTLIAGLQATPTSDHRSAVPTGVTPVAEALFLKDVVCRWLPTWCYGR